MSEVAGKPRLSYAEWQAQQKKGLTVSALIHRFETEMESVKPLGNSHRLSLRKLARGNLGAKVAAELTPGEIIDWCKARSEIAPATRGQYLGYLSGVLKYAKAAWADCKAVSDAAIKDPKPYLSKQGLIGKSVARDRRPTLEEQATLLALFEEQNKRPRNKIDMATIARWQIASSRRISETARLTWGDWDKATCTIVVHKMKDPKRRDKTKRLFLPPAAQAILLELEPKRLTPSDPAERIFKVNSHSVSARYTEAKHICGIDGLRLHDSRRECASTLIENGYTPAEAILVTGHDTTRVFEGTYMRPRAELLKDGPASKRVAAAPIALAA